MEARQDNQTSRSVVIGPTSALMKPISSSIVGTVERVNYFNEDSGQCVLNLKLTDTDSRILISARIANIFPGYTVVADLLSDQKVYPYRTQNLQIIAPQSARSLKKFLRSGALAGVGPKLSNILANAFPQDLLDVLAHQPDRLLDVPGVGKKRLAQLKQSWSDHQSKVELNNFLFLNQLPLSWNGQIWPIYSDKSISKFLKTPYEAALEFDFFFDVIDNFALRNGFTLDNKIRIRTAIILNLRNYYKQGHCAYPEEKLINELLAKLEITKDSIDEALEVEILNEHVVCDRIGPTGCLYLQEIWQLEQHVADKFKSFLKKEPPWGWFNSDKMIGWAQSILNIQLAPKQKEALETVLTSSLTVITGGPGTGKTTLIQSLVTILETQFLKFALCSPTGRAAQRLSQATGHPAKTVHRLLKAKNGTGDFSYNKKNPLKLDLVLVDEASMMDISLMSSLLDALPEQCALVLVGDADQIPSVGAGTVLRSLISSKRFNLVRLTDIFRQSEKSLIKINAKRINEGQMPLVVSEGPKDFHYIPVQDPQTAKKVLLNLVTRIIPTKCNITDPAEVQILVPMNKGFMGTQQLNEELQEIRTKSTKYSGPNLEGMTDIEQSFKLGDKVMVIKNNYVKDVFNGDTGFITRIIEDAQYIEVDIDQRLIRFTFEELDHLTLAYAVTIHKSQGSEYRAVIVIIMNEHLPMAQRHLIYTAVTRGKEYVFLIADPKALEQALQTVEERWEKLTELLQQQ